MPCNNCSACLMNDCGGCKFCLDKRKFGGPGKLKKRCELRQCVTPKQSVGGSPNQSNASNNKGVTLGGYSNQQIKNSGGANNLARQVVRNKFLTTIEQRKPDFESSFDDSFTTPPSKSFCDDDNTSLLAESREALENIIEMGLETFEVVNVQADNETDRPCYVCHSSKTKNDLFYCSSCCVPFHQQCLGRSQGRGESSCSNCSNSKTRNFEQAMNARADSIHAKCEKIDGAEYQVISFLPDDPSIEPLKMNVEVVQSPPISLSLSSLTASQGSTVMLDLPQVFLQTGSCGQESGSTLQPLNDMPQNYDMDFDAYLHTISLQQ